MTMDEESKRGWADVFEKVIKDLAKRTPKRPGRAPYEAAPCKIGYVNAGHTIPEPHITI